MDSKKKTKFKNELIKKLPFFPDDKETLAELNNQNLSEVLLHYLHWSSRQVPQRVRRVNILPELTADGRYKKLKEPIKLLLNKVRRGENLSPYLSKKAHKKGYTPVKRVTDKQIDSWEDKDQILNTKGFYHFHLNMEIQESGLSHRTSEVLFAKINRGEFHAVAIFDHTVFDNINADKESSERKRMWEIHQKYETVGMKPGTIYMSNPIMMSGHPLYLVQMSLSYMRFIDDVDPKLDDRAFVNELYGQTKIPSPNKYNLTWNLDGLDLTLLDTKNRVNFSIFKGYI